MQTDLFGTISQSPSSTLPPAPTKPAFLERYRWTIRLDQMVVIAILFLILFVFVFSFGVESGKKYAMEELKAERAKRERLAEEFRAQVEANRAAAPNPSVPMTQKIELVKPSGTESLTQKEEGGSSLPSSTLSINAEERSFRSVPSGNFTIQWVAYASKPLADRQIQNLSEKGLRAFIIPSGRYFLLCVDAFDSRTAARQMLAQLKERGIAPPDAYVRPMSA